MAQERYKIVRFFQYAFPNRRIIKTGLTLQEAQAHCGDPETSSKTCTSSYRKRYTRDNGPWFDGYRSDGCW